MIIIGEKINGAIPSVKKAILEKNSDFIKNLAIKQAEAGADFIDICASTRTEYEVETLKWLMEIVQEAVDTPLCIDSPNPLFIKEVLPFARKPGIINSVSLELVEGTEQDKCDIIFPLVKGTNWGIIALTCDDGYKTLHDVDKRIEITKKLVEKANDYGILPDKLYIDPLVMALSTDNNSLLNFIESVKQIKALYPRIKVTSGLSNISFGMPARKLINQNFMTLSMYVGMDSAIMDPLNKDIMSTIYATEALLAKDRYCRKFNKAFRSGVIE